MKLESLRDLDVEPLKDLYNAEQQLIKALSKNGEGGFVGRIKGRF
jgi:ferritin-like metal-binding protein YciE